MSSNQWELVTKSKKQKNFEKKIEAHTEKKRQAAVGPKLEEILPSHQYRNLISGKSTGKENQSPAKSNASSTKSKSPKKSAKTNAHSKDEHKKQQQQPKPATIKPKSLESALRNITSEDFLAHLTQLKLSFPASELLWLKGIASYLNTTLPFQCDPIFSAKSVHYPSNLASSDLKNTIVKFLESVGESNLAYFYHTLLASMTAEMSKNLPIVGYKFLLQLIGQNWPDICADNMARTALLRNSYQNRSNICLTILWAIGQGGYQKLVDGIKVWQNLMLPNLELKSYTKFIVEYIENILVNSTDRSLNLNQNDFFTTYNALKANYSGMQRDLQESLHRSAEAFLQTYIANVSKHANIFLTLFRDIESSNNRVELNGCRHCLVRSDDSFKVWKMNYKKKLLPSVLLLNQIKNDMEGAAAPLIASKAFHKFIADADLLNAELASSKRRDNHLDDLIAALTGVQEKVAQQKKKQSTEQKKGCGCCKWVLGSLILFGLISAVLLYDTNVNGKGVFERSTVGQVLKRHGLLPHVEKAWYTVMGASARGYKWAEKHVPPYVKPAAHLVCDVTKLVRNAACNAYTAIVELVSTKLPVAAQFVEQYIPGLPNKIGTAATSVREFASVASEQVVTFFRTKVFVGYFSPENLSNVLNNTQNLAGEYINIFHRKVDVYAKLK